MAELTKIGNAKAADRVEARLSSYATRKAKAAALSGPADKLSTAYEAPMPLGVSSTTIWNMVREGEAKTFKIGARTLIKRAELEDVSSERRGSGRLIAFTARRRTHEKASRLKPQARRVCLSRGDAMPV